jgi:RNA polymerase sigma factor (sigma-70 family)
MDLVAFEQKLAEERPRLVRLCAWLTGSTDGAEDLAQDVLEVAWKNRTELWSAEKLKPWLSGIARNVCLDWSRKRVREQAHLDFSADPSEETISDRLSDDIDLEFDLDRADLAKLLDEALALLPPATGHILIEHYLNQTPHAEIAAQLSMNPGTIAVRIQRGKLSLQRLLKTQLKEDALAFGLFRPDSLDWEETNMWCPMCGQSRLLGQFQWDAAGGRFTLRCSSCKADPDAVMVGMDLTNPYYAGLLRDVKAYKPAYKRIKAFVSSFYRQALVTGGAACPVCGQPAIIQVSDGEAAGRFAHPARDIFIACSACDWASNSSTTGLALSLPEAQKFWQENPRIRTILELPVESEGVQADVVRLESITSAATLAMVTRRDTLEPLRVYANGQAQT